MAAGLPVVGADWSDYRDTVIHNETGFRIPTRWADCNSAVSLFAPLEDWRSGHLRLSQSVAVDIDELIDCLDALIGNPEKRMAMGQAARDHTLARLSWKGVIGQHAALWHELAEIAARLPQENPPYTLLRQPQYFKNYCHFATQCLSGSEELVVTARGRHAYQNLETIFMHSEMKQILTLKVLLGIVKFVKMAHSFRMPATIEDVCDKIGPKHSLDREAALAHAMWLLKYGYIQIVK